jgi:SLT domain-containing protein
MFGALTSSEASTGLTNLEKTANAFNNIATAITNISDAYSKLKPFAKFLPSEFIKSKIWDALTNQPAKAAGGSVMANRPYTVGEFGPETFVPNGSGSIRPNGGLGNGGVTIIMNGVIDGESARRSIEKLLQDSSRRTGAINLVGATL